jgi:hypothetical protein
LIVNTAIDLYFGSRIHTKVNMLNVNPKLTLKEYREMFPDKELVPDYLIEIILACGPITYIGDPIDGEKCKRVYRKYHKCGPERNNFN